MQYTKLLCMYTKLRIKNHRYNVMLCVYLKQCLKTLRYYNHVSCSRASLN